MCRFSVTNAPPPAPESPGLEQLLDDDDFCWFDAIADLPDEQVDNVTAGFQQDAPVARSSESSDMGQSDNKPSASGGFSDTSSYDLMELFKQQVEQDPAVMMASMQAQFGFASFAANAALEQSMVAGASAGAGVKMPCFQGELSPASAMPAAVMAPAPAALVMPAPNYSPAAGLNMTPAMPVATPAAPAAAPIVRKPGTKLQRSQEEQEAAVERIKQKRRESAQRSRARKNEYMRQLEVENQSLKEEVHRLQNMITALQRQSCMQQQLSPTMVA